VIKGIMISTLGTRSRLSFTIRKSGGKLGHMYSVCLMGYVTSVGNEGL